MRLLKIYLQFYALIVPVVCNIVYITDINAWSSLAPCAANAVSQVVQYLTSSTCPSPVSDLQSCACTKDKNAAVVASAVSSSVLDACGPTATEDVTSASALFSRYCNQDALITSAPSSPTLVSRYITDLSAFSTLAPCAASGLSSAVQYLTSAVCPSAPSALASCACSKNKNSAAANGLIETAVFSYCGHGQYQDATSAQIVFAGYCGLAAGITSFPTPTVASGALTTYITDLPIYSSLAPCAASAIGAAVLGRTADLCPSPAAIFASCACAKDQNSITISSILSASASYSCGSTAKADVTSVLSVFDFYCSNAIKILSITTSGMLTKIGPSAPAGSTASSTFTSASNSEISGNSSSGPNIGAVVGGVVGGVVLIAVVCGIWICRRYRRVRASRSKSDGNGPNTKTEADEKMPVTHEDAERSTSPPKSQNPGYRVTDMPVPAFELTTDSGTDQSNIPPELYHQHPVFEIQGHDERHHELPLMEKRTDGPNY